MITEILSTSLNLASEKTAHSSHPSPGLISRLSIDPVSEHFCLKQQDLEINAHGLIKGNRRIKNYYDIRKNISAGYIPGHLRRKTIKLISCYTQMYHGLSKI